MARYLIIFIAAVLFVVVHQPQLQAASGVGAIIEQAQAEEAAANQGTAVILSGGTVHYENFENNGTTIEGVVDESYDYGDGSSSNSSDFFHLNLSIDQMKNAVASGIGLPNANVLVLLLFSLAALIEMGRVISGGSGWVPFVMRVVIALAFLECFNLLFNGAEVFFSYLGSSILNGQSAVDVVWSAQGPILNKLKEGLDAGGMLGVFKTEFIENALMYVVITLSSLLSYSLYILIYLVQACIIIALKYLGPVVISLAIIPETNYTSGYISSTIQVLSWTIIASILIKIMSTIPIISMSNNLGMSDMVALAAMNICFAFAFLSVPLISGMIFSGHGIGALGGAVTGFAFGTAVGLLKGKDHENKEESKSATQENSSKSADNQSSAKSGLHVSHAWTVRPVATQIQETDQTEIEGNKEQPKQVSHRGAFLALPAHDSTED